MVFSSDFIGGFLCNICHILEINFWFIVISMEGRWSGSSDTWISKCRWYRDRKGRLV